MKLNINSDDIRVAKLVTSMFDKQKTFNKFECDSNYIGFLSEFILNRYFTANGVGIEWINFLKTGWNEPDFVFNGVSIDVKASHSNKLYIKRPVHDIYVFTQVFNDYIQPMGFITKEGFNSYICSGVAKEVKFGTRTTYMLDSKYLIDISLLSIFTGCSQTAQDCSGEEIIVSESSSMAKKRRA